MLTLISLIIVIIGIANWLSIGAFQYDFVAGLFGSQANMFSRLVYVLVGIAGIFLTYSIIRNKGKLVFKNKNDKALFSFGKKAKANAESANDNSINDEKNLNQENSNHNNSEENSKTTTYIESANDNSLNSNSSNNTEASFDNSINSNAAIQEKASRINDKNKLSSKNYYTESSNDNSRNSNNNE